MLAWGGNNASTGSGTSDGAALVKLTDFGIVRVAEDAGLTNSGIVLGTADYLSPEQARGETLTASSDLYSLAVVMFEMLTGRPPFVGPTAVSIAMQHASASPPSLRQFNSNVPPALDQLIMRTLEKEPEDRFVSAAEMQQALRICTKEIARSKPLAQPAQSYPRNYSLGVEGPGQAPPQGRKPYSQ
jgi:serine/threonine-protein kinase